MKKKEMAALGAFLFLGCAGVWLLSKTHIFGSGISSNGRRVSKGHCSVSISKTLKKRRISMSSKVQHSPLRIPRSGRAKKPTYTREIVRGMCLIQMYKRVSKPALLFLFKIDTADRTTGQSLDEFYLSRGATVKKGMNPNQKRKIDSDPEGESFDVTILCRCLRSGRSQVLASENDAKWNEEDKGTLESLITALKNKRNSLCHEEPQYSRKGLLQEIQKIRRMLNELMTLTGQHYGLPQARVESAITGINSIINNHFRGDPDFTKELASDFVGNEGKEEVQDQYGKRGDTKVTPLSHMDSTSFEVEDIFTEMKLENESRKGQKKAVRCEDLLLDNTLQNNDGNLVILIEGRAGVGKTTLVKKILNEWRSKMPSKIKELDSYTLVFHSECRHPTIKSYIEILQCLMPETAKYFNDNTLREAALSHRNLVILDGLDEINQSSKKLFREILQLKKDKDRVTVIITTRPEKLEYFYETANHLNIKTKHIQLLGVPHERRDEFVSKYHSELQKKNPNIHSVDGLLEFLGRGRRRHQELWRLPFNLTALVLIWEHNPSHVDSVTTSTELYWQMHMLHQMKLKERLTAHTNTDHLDDEDIEQSMNSLGREALLGLVFNNINLSEESYRRLKADCIQRQIPHEEITGAFLKKVLSTMVFGFHVIFSFPHKGLQDFFGALHIFKVIQSESRRHNLEIDERTNVRTEEEMSPVPLSSSSTSLRSEQKSVVIRNLLKKLHGSQPLEIEKYQNLFSILIGLMHLHPGKIEDNMKMEVLELLQETGVTNWLSILEDNRCDAFIAAFISQQSGILRGLTNISDSNIHAYISLLSAFQSPLEDPEGVYITIGIIEEFLSPWNHLMTVLDFHKLTVRRVMICDKSINHYISLLKSPPQPFKPLEKEIELRIFHKATEAELLQLMEQINNSKMIVECLDLTAFFKQEALNPLLKNAIANVLERCQLREYKGPIVPAMVAQRLPKDLWVSIPDTNSFRLWRDYLNTDPHLELLGICVSPSVDVQVLIPLPGNTFIPPILLVPDVNESSLLNACNIIRRLNPNTERMKSFGNIYFPRACMTEETLKRLLERMEGVNVIASIIFPTECRPSSPEIENDLLQQAKDILGCSEIIWGKATNDKGGGILDLDSW